MCGLVAESALVALPWRGAGAGAISFFCWGGGGWELGVGGEDVQCVTENPEGEDGDGERVACEAGIVVEESR